MIVVLDTNTVALNLGDIDARWLRSSGTYGDNYMVFDNYQVTAGPSQAPKIITPPQNQSVTAGGAARFLVVADSPLQVSYQWLFNGAEMPGANGPTLALDPVTLSQQGNYSVVVGNAAGVVTSAPPASLAVLQPPNLAPFRPSGWSDKIVTATAPGTNDATAISPTQDIFVSWAALNSAAGSDITARFYTQLYVDGVLNHTWSSDGLNRGFYAFVTGYAIGPLSAGTHTIRIDVDATSVIPESDETDNSYTKTFVVSSAGNPPPQLSAPSRATNGVFQLTLIGVPSRTYEIQTSTNLADWSVLATLVNTNTNGVLPFLDPGATNIPIRFYRSRLVIP